MPWRESESMSRFHLSPLCLASLLLLGGCASLGRSEYRQPELSLPAAWQHPAAPQAPGDAWWQAFAEPQLDTYVATALTRNNDLAAAGMRLRRARLNAGLADDKRYPSLSASAGSSFSKRLDNAEGSTRSHSAQAAVAWEADLWGRLASARDAAAWEASATEQDLASTRLALIGDTVRLYWQLAYLNQRIDLSDQSIAHAERAKILAGRKLAAGAVSRLDVLQAEQDLAAQQAAHQQLLQQREEARSSFALLFDGGLSPGFAEARQLPAGELPGVSAGLPAELLARRPDLSAAELRLRSTLASADATRLGYYPALSLTGSVGSSSERLREVIANPLGTLAAELSLPLLKYREMKLATGVAETDYELALLAFRQTLYTALTEVENALSARQQYQVQGVLLAQSLAAASEVERISEARYRAGAISMQDWLDAAEKRRDAEASLAENRFNQIASLTTLNLALGTR